jgi:hypothetical protein
VDAGRARQIVSAAADRIDELPQRPYFRRRDVVLRPARSTPVSSDLAVLDVRLPREARFGGSARERHLERVPLRPRRELERQAGAGESQLSLPMTIRSAP